MGWAVPKDGYQTQISLCAVKTFQVVLNGAGGKGGDGGTELCSRRQNNLCWKFRRLAIGSTSVEDYFKCKWWANLSFLNESLGRVYACTWQCLTQHWFWRNSDFFMILYEVGGRLRALSLFILTAKKIWFQHGMPLLSKVLNDSKINIEKNTEKSYTKSSA